MVAILLIVKPINNEGKSTPSNLRHCLNYCTLIPETNELHKRIKEMDCRIGCHYKYGF
jgi:hypothetical protein